MRPSRVLILFDASPQALHALEVATELASHHQAPLVAIYVEEPYRQRGLAYSFSHEVSALSGAIHRIDPGLHRLNADRTATAVRRAIEQVTSHRRVKWELLVLRGQLVEEILAISKPGDSLLLGCVGWSARLGRKLGGTPLTLARRANASVQICSPDIARSRAQVAVLIEEWSPSSEAMLHYAARRAEVGKRTLVVLASPLLDDEDATRLNQSLASVPTPWRLRKLPRMTSGEMFNVLAEERVVELVVRRGGDWLQSETPQRILERMAITINVMA